MPIALKTENNMNTIKFNPLSKPMYNIPIKDKSFSLYEVYCGSNLVVLMSLDFAGTQFYVSQRKRTVKIVIPPLKGLDSNPYLICLWQRIANMFHAKLA